MVRRIQNEDQLAMTKIVVLTYILQVFTAIVASIALCVAIFFIHDGNVAKALWQLALVVVNVTLFFIQGHIRKEHRSME